MTLHTEKAVGACGVSDYWLVIQQAQSQPEQVDCATGLQPNHRVVVPEIDLQYDMKHEFVVSTEGMDELQNISLGKSRESLPGAEVESGEQRFLYISDSSCGESSCPLGGRRHNRALNKAQSRPFKRTVDQCQRVSRSDSSHSEEDNCGEDYLSDSSWDSETSKAEPRPRTHKQKMAGWRTLARGRFEEMLLECIVNTVPVGLDDIPPNYGNIFLDRKVIDEVEHVTTLGLKRPKAFSHGVLKNNKVTGAVLYGPPGTGKSLLARGVAKQSGFNMLSISTSEVWQKCHGDDEKMIRAIFSMVRKMYPSIIFLDEADAMLGERKAGEKRHLRAMLNKFLMEWDGITSGIDSPFILLATNRPNDLDPAVLRRAPVRIHLNLPTKAERSGILGLLLTNETLDRDIDAPTLASLTPQYTGSDLKNFCVAAATKCIAEQSIDTTERVLRRQHFMAAMQTIKKATAISKTREQDLHNFQNNRQEQAEE
ncbi:ATPase family AAA domain-containing protein 1 [Cytospora mali]|uniref:ATPase family AAA domain-containing protein 1 n=1 Tax=Cytospora mali TaxID=578113 RepID=A0A194V785_CYTMA|nr:ATPase family AAA domain-containing protein 1 [Valsa mali var. pyri (nom. inval.)]